MIGLFFYGYLKKISQNLTKFTTNSQDFFKVVVYINIDTILLKGELNNLWLI